MCSRAPCSRDVRRKHVARLSHQNDVDVPPRAAGELEPRGVEHLAAHRRCAGRRRESAGLPRTGAGSAPGRPVRGEMPLGAALPTIVPSVSSRYTSTLGLTCISCSNRSARHRAAGLCVHELRAGAMCCARSRDKPCTTSCSCIWLERTCIHADVPQHTSSNGEHQGQALVRVSLMAALLGRDTCSRAPRP